MQNQQTGMVVLNRLSRLVINWAYVESIDFKSNSEAIIYYNSGNHKVVEGQGDIAALYDMVSVFPNIADDPTRKQMKQLSMTTLPNIQTDISDPSVGGRHGRPIEGPRTVRSIGGAVNVAPKTDFPDRP